MAAPYARGSVLEGGAGTVIGGLRLYFGQKSKTLMRRHREEDPPNFALDNIGFGNFGNGNIGINTGISGFGSTN